MRRMLRWLLPILLFFCTPLLGHTAEVTLEWSPNNLDLVQGYLIYINRGASIHRNAADMVIIPVTSETPDFDPSAPSLTIYDLEDDVV